MPKKGDFVKIEYTAYDQHGNIFDSTSGDIAKQLHGKEGELLIVLGVDYIVKGVEEALMTMKKGESRDITITPDKAFGTRERKRVRVMPIEAFYKNNLDPKPGTIIQLETDYGTLNGIVKSVNSGRVLVDFNHPLADQTVRYTLKLSDIIETPEGKISALMSDLGIEGTFEIKDGKVVIIMKKNQPDEELKKTRMLIAIKSAVKELMDVEFKSA